MGGSLSKGKSQSTTAPSSIWGSQAPYLEDLYSRAQGAASGGGIDPYAQQVSQGAMPGFQNQIGGGFQNQQMMQNLQGLGSGQFQNQALGGAIQAGLGDINRNFQRNIMPSINTGAAMTNTAGGSRQGIAQGLAASDANRQAGDFVNKMYSQNFGQQLQSMLGANQQMGGLQGQQNIAQQQALGMAPQTQQLGMAPQMNYWQQQFAPLQGYSDVVGRPAILGGGSQASSKNTGISGGIGFGV